MTPPYELFIGLRYLRAKRRHRTVSLNTFISIGGVTLGVAALIATLAVMTGFKEDLRDKILGTNAHVIVTHQLSEPFSDYLTILPKVEETPDVTAAAPFTLNQVLLSVQDSVQGVVLRGIDPARESGVTDLGKNLVQGVLEDLTRPQLSDRPDGKPQPGIILGKELASRLGTFMGDTVQVVSPISRQMGPTGIIPKIRHFTVVGLFESGMYEYDSGLAFVSIRTAQDFFNLGDAVTGIQVKVRDIFQSDRVARAIEERLGFPYWARDWMQMNRNLFSALKLEKIVMFIILVLIILVASFNIVSTLTMIVVEKSREIAILKAMGATQRSVMWIFMVDGLIIGLVGIAIGIPLGYFACWVIGTFYTLDTTIYYISHIPVRIKLFDVVSVSIAAVLISFLATLYPSRRAARLNPSEALRYE
jgi:lipoprotein-releasing system permease protein